MLLTICLVHHEIYTEFFFGCKNEKFHCKKIDTFQNIDCWYTEAVLTSTLNHKKNRYTPAFFILLYKSGVQGDIHYVMLL